MLKRAVQKFFSAFGYRLVPTSRFRPTWSLDHFFPLMQSFGFAPKNIWDVGANHGDWTREALRYFPDSCYTLIEPQDRLRHHIGDLVNRGHKIRWIAAGVGHQSGTFPFYIGWSDEASSFLNVPRIIGEATDQLNVTMHTLDELRHILHLPVPEMLKIDAEGFELKVLQGATDILGKTEIVLVEASIGQRDFENTAGAVIAAMDGHGYRLIDITDVNRSPNHGLLWLCEFAFLLKSSTRLDRASKY